MLQKLKYLARSIRDFNQQRICPYCGSENLKKIDSKYFFTTLLDCQNCHLHHRHPKDDPKFIEKFYQSDYSIDVHMMTKLPSDEKVEELKKTNFPNLVDYSPYVKAVLGDKSKKVIDYGCSWGYSVFKLANSGFDAIGFELSIPRAEFGCQKLGVPIKTNENDIRVDNDLLLNSHVIEHLLDIRKFIELCKSKLKEDGIFMAFCPNGSKEYRKREPEIFHGNWGFVHPNYLNIPFASYLFKDNPHLILTGDWVHDLDQIRNWDGKSKTVGEKKDGKELLIIAKPNRKI